MASVQLCYLAGCLESIQEAAPLAKYELYSADIELHSSGSSP